ncbi:hypothetical protein FIBSPDRAFT_158955 [Athelia psychrophila]|uniref:Uncharacterized protein n=1 Tax=Athelia psychrophila TaxID=1759441 RepID=A0A166STY1_9AGAM|nr:hypothetical protein FIBSPDRAFT_158955 [Fibularhizoctonia sp. CBS 109695]
MVLSGTSSSPTRLPSNRSTTAISRNSKSGAPSSPLSPRKSAANNSREPFAAQVQVYIRSRECRRRQSCVPG